ncbi:MAG TPA: Gfo/Idh/MocA family oxidoreductase [Chitinophagaceae bacterium]|nr:Gfo/Idh/MocA family oxidoreductase [Chitinophagaceae bacterium]
MIQDKSQNNSVSGIDNEKATEHTAQPSQINRRKFVGMAATSALAFTIVPRHVLGRGHVAPSDKITLAYIGIGTQGIRELLPMLQNDQIQVVAVADPNKDAVGYRDWSPFGSRNEIRKVVKDPNWTSGGDNTVPGGRDVGKSIVDTYYKNVRPDWNMKGCTAYEDSRELLEKEKDIDAVKIMTPDHLHGVLAMAAVKRGKHVLLHKPLSNRLLEGKKVIEACRNSKSITHLIPWDSNGDMTPVMAWINSGAIGTLTEIHNWTNRPVWPQYPMKPAEEPVPSGLNWDLWIGPEAMRPYSSEYTNMVFRGWYDFGGGSMADMGHYSLWTVFNALKLTSPHTILPHLSHVVAFNGVTPYQIRNDFSFPFASTVTFKYPANGDRGPVDLCWYDGGMQPPVPPELAAQNKELPTEGMMFVGTEGKILAGFNVQNPQLISGKKTGSSSAKADTRDQVTQESAALPLFVNACRSGKQYPGSFPEAEYLTEAVNLYSVALRTGKLLRYDAATQKITNAPDANKYLNREYRSGWDPATI